MAERRNLDRIRYAKGSQPVVFDEPVTDALAAMVIALLGEVSVLRDRLDANERLLLQAGVHGPDNVDAYQPDERSKQQRSIARDGMYDRVLGAGRDKLLPSLLVDRQLYDETLSAVAE